MKLQHIKTAPTVLVISITYTYIYTLPQPQLSHFLNLLLHFGVRLHTCTGSYTGSFQDGPDLEAAESAFSSSRQHFSHTLCKLQSINILRMLINNIF